MSATSIRAYWPLIKSVIVPFGIMKVILIMVAVSFALMFVVAWFLQGEAKDVAPVLLMTIFIYIFFMVILLPSQALTVISSKSLRYVTDFKKFYLVVAVILSMAFPLAVIIFRLVTTEPAKEICTEGVCAELKSINESIGFRNLSHFGLQVWLLSSAYIIGLFFTAYRFPLFQGAIFFTFAVIGQILNLLAQWSFVQLILASSLSWLAFGFWWLRLKPQKFFIYAYAMNMEQMMSAGTTANPSVNPTAVAVTNFLSPSSKPASLLGTRVMGMPDGNSGVFRMGLLNLMMSLLLLCVFKWIFKDNFQNFIKHAGIGVVFYLAVAGYYGILTTIYRNIKASWLLFPGSRDQLFRFIEKRCFDYSIKIMWVTPIMAILVNQLSGISVINVLSFIVVFLSVVIFNAMTLYLTISTYSRDSDSKIGSSGWQAINIFLSILVLGLICVLLSMNYHLVTMAIMALILTINFLLRQSLLKKWQTINFVRVG